MVCALIAPRELRKDPIQPVGERRMLNTNEDSFESLRAPTRRPNQLAQERVGVDIPAPAHTGDEGGSYREQPKTFANGISVSE